MLLDLMSRSLMVDFIFIFIFFLSLFSIFRTTQVKVYQSQVMAWSHDRSQDMGEGNRRFWNKVTLYNMDNICGPHIIHMVIRVECTVVSMDHG